MRQAQSRRGGLRAGSHAGGSLKLYRVVSDLEFAQLLSSGRFQCTAGSLEGKWFAETAADARAWGAAFARIAGIRHVKIVEVEISAAHGRRLHRIEMLDGIGPARFATIDQLKGVVPREVAT